MKTIPLIILKTQKKIIKFGLLKTVLTNKIKRTQKTTYFTNYLQQMIMEIIISAEFHLKISKNTTILFKKYKIIKPKQKNFTQMSLVQVKI